MLWISGLLAAGMMAAPPDTVRIRGDTPACSSCRLTVTPLVVLGSPGDTVGPDLQYWVAADSRGRYYVAPTIGLGQVAVYDSTGRLLGLLGRRGQGPGEFEHAGSAIPQAHRIIIFTPTFNVKPGSIATSARATLPGW
ncbi:hypothetical protein HRbin33_01121 [bacterium HR33]|nr:hypothetical protein HRbin33_01121 [bacterium HR33]